MNFSGTSGKVALVNSATALGCGGTSLACTPEQLALIIDMVGYGTANLYEGTAAAPALSATTAALRAGNGCTDTDDNAADFTAVTPAPLNSASPTYTCPVADLVIYQVYGGGGNTGAQYHNDFIVLYNRGGAPASLNGLSLQYASNTGNFNSAATLPITKTVAAGEYFLVQLAAGAGGGAALPEPIDATGSLGLGGTNGKVALVISTTVLPCGSTVIPTPCTPEQLALIVDLVGYGSATMYEGSGPAPALSNTTAGFRKENGCTDTDDNAADFSVAAPAPLNSASPTYTCPVSTDPTGVGAADPSTVVIDYTTTLLTVVATPGSAAIQSVICDLSAIGGSATQDFYDDGTNGDATAADNTFSFSTQAASSTTAGAKSLDCTITATDAGSGSASIDLTAVDALASSKTAVAEINVGQTMTYTLAVTNNLPITVTNVVITDSLPLSVTYQSSSPVGSLAGNIISWNLLTLASGATSVLEVGVTAPAEETTLVNSDYGAWATEWVTRTVGSAVNTTVKDPDKITPIADARAAGVGWTGNIQGKVTVPTGIYATTYNAFVIQDDTGGIYIYAPLSKVLPPMVLGDVVKINGTIKSYNGFLEIDPMNSATWISSGSPVTPESIPTTSVASTQGKLVEVSGTVNSPNTYVPGSDFTFYITDSFGQIAIFVDKDTKIDMSWLTTGMSLRVTGFSTAYYSTYQIMPRYASDIIDLSAPTVTGTVPVTGTTGVSLYYPLEATFSKAMKASSLNDTSFLLHDALGTPVTGVVTYDAGSKTASFQPSAALAPLTTYTATLTTAILDIYDIPMTAPFYFSFTTTDTTDTTPPAITAYYPEADAIDIPLTASVNITFTEDLHPLSRTSSHFILTGPYGTVPTTLYYYPGAYMVELVPSARLLPTTLYTVTVTGDTADWAGLTLGADVQWNFTTSVEPPMMVYFGDIHNHTSYSDGSGTPTQALAAGQAAGFDFMAITDHSYAISDPEWADTLAAVNAATNGNFVALRGFEYTQGAEGHINVYNTVRHAVRTDTTATCTFCDYTPNLEYGVTVEGFYRWLTTVKAVALDGAGSVMQFNHPGWINFNDWTFHPEISAVARMEEVGNGNGSSYAFSEEEYIRSLDYGWRVGASNNADTHTDYWGLNTDHRTGVLMPGLTKADLLEALRERRTFATEDKNFALRMKANGAWMGAEIANSGSILFEIDGTDPDAEFTTLVQIITDQGVIAASYTPGTPAWTWQPQLTITTGVHYFYVKATQADGDRIVSSPVWTLGDEDIAITDIIIQPTVPTIYNASLLTARVTNRVSESRTVTVTMDVDGVALLPAVEVTVPANGDAYANFTWQPSVTGDVTVTAELDGAPVTDNPDDNSASLELTVTDELLPLILIDAGHGNMNAAGREMRFFIDDLSAHGYNVLKNLDALTATDLDPNVVKLLLITAPQTAYTEAELTDIANYVNAGGSLWLCGLADYNKSVAWADTVADRENAILARIETVTGQTINMRMNDDEVIDGDDNNGYVFGVQWSSFPSAATTGIGNNVAKIASWSLSSIRGRLVTQPVTSSTPNVQIVVQGDLDPGWTSYPNPLHTSQIDYDGMNDAYIYNPGWTQAAYPDTVPADAIPLVMSAVTDLDGAPGRIMLYGDSNDPFTMFAYTAGDGLQNELFNLQSVMWLLGEPLTKSTIAEARAQAVEDEPDNLDSLVWVEGYITAAYNEFFNVLYVQDDTGGITVHAPAGDINAGDYTRGTKVRVIGTVGIYNGDTEIEFFEAEMVQVLESGGPEVIALPFTTYQASLEANQGWLGVITGTVTAKIGSDTLIIDDGSGPVRIFIDGYNGDFSDIDMFDQITVTGLISEDGDGGRIRVRNHIVHTPPYLDDVILWITNHILFPLVRQ